MTPTSSAPTPASSTSRRWPSILLGLLMLLPAAICCGSTLLAPSMQTFILSQQKYSGLGSPVYVGGANFTSLAQAPTTSKAISFTLEMTLVRLLAVAVVPLLLALAAGALGRWVSGGTRLLFTLPLALFAPTGLAVVWLMTRTPATNPFASVSGAQGTLFFLDGAQTLALACAVGLVTYLAALRAGDGSNGSRWRAVGAPLALVWFVNVLAALASGLQIFNLPYLLTRGGPGSATTTLMLLEYQMGFVVLQFGQGAAVASGLLLTLLGLGILAGLALVLSNARLDHAAASGAAPSLMPAVLAVAVLVVLGLLAFGLWVANQLPLVQALGLPERGGAGAGIQTNLSNSLAGPMAVLVVQLPLAYLAALGIGALRPLGRWSEWLLLPFSPWLFVTLGPLSVVEFINGRQGGTLNTPLALASPLLLSVPMLMVLALFFKGRAAHWQAARTAGRSALGAFFGEVVLPSLPLAVLLAVVGMLVSNQELLWPLLAASRPALATGNVSLTQALGRLVAGNGSLARAVWAVALPGFVFGLIALGLLQVLYVGRLVLRTGAEGDNTAKA